MLVYYSLPHSVGADMSFFRCILCGFWITVDYEVLVSSRTCYQLCVWFASLTDVLYSSLRLPRLPQLSKWAPTTPRVVLKSFLDNDRMTLGRSRSEKFAGTFSVASWCRSFVFLVYLWLVSWLSTWILVIYTVASERKFFSVAYVEWSGYDQVYFTWDRKRDYCLSRATKLFKPFFLFIWDCAFTNLFPLTVISLHSKHQEASLMGHV